MEIKNELTVNLAKAFLSLVDESECLDFFSDLFTAKEIAELSGRLEVARLLKSGVNYIDIANQTGVSTATISRVSKCLSGERGGYRKVLSRITEEKSSLAKEELEGLTPGEIEALRAVISCFKCN